MTQIIPEPSHRMIDPESLVEMSWDPITRIVGSLGIYTKIDFKNREVVECNSTSSIFRGYSIYAGDGWSMCSARFGATARRMRRRWRR